MLYINYRPISLILSTDKIKIAYTNKNVGYDKTNKV